MLFALALFGAETAEAIFQKAAAALSAHDYPAAESAFLRVLKLEPRNIGALGNLGVVYSRQQRHAAAIETYKRALSLAPGEKFLSTNLGLAYIRQEQYGAALPIFEKLAAPDNLQAIELLATCRLLLGRNPEAAAAIERIPLEQRSSGGLYTLGIALTRLHRIDEAHAAFTKMMETVDPQQANFLMGQASYETEHFAEAVEFFRKAGAHRELGKTYVSLHDDENAEKELRLAGPDDPEALYFLGAAIAHTQPNEAIGLLEKAHRLNPEFWGPLYYLGRIQVAMGHSGEAIRLLTQASKFNPEEPAIYYQLGQAYKKAGRPTEAQAALARVKDLKSRTLQKEIQVLSPASR